MNAQKSLSSISANRVLWIAQYHQELHERDRFSGLEAARRDGERKKCLPCQEVHVHGTYGRRSL